MKFSCCLLAALLSAEVQSQMVSGRVLDQQSGRPLAYVHVGVLGRNIGTISRENGEFILDISGIPQSEKITFSMVGYTTVSVNISNIPTSELIISLIPSVTQLDEIIIRDEPLIELVKLGLPEATKTTIGHSGNHEWGTGSEWGLRIPTGAGLFKLHEIGFHTRFNTVDSVLFRINIYSGTDSLPGETLLRQDIYVKSYKRDKWIIRKIEDEEIVTNEDIIVTIEILRIWYGKVGDNQLFFTYGKGNQNLPSYSRQSSQDKWRINEMPQLALYVLVRKLGL